MPTFLECLENKKLRFPTDAWKKKENQLLFLKYFAKKEGYKTKEDWYKMKHSTIIKYRGSGLLNYFDRSTVKLLKFIDPNYDWKLWLFSSVPNNYWKDKTNHKLLFNWLGEELGYTKPEDWYNISREQIRKNEGDGLIGTYYNHSHIQFIKAMLPEYDFKLFLFKTSPKGIWSSFETRKEYMEWLREEKDLKNLNDLYNITYDLVDKNHGYTLLKYYKWSIQKFVKDIYPEYDWKPWLFSCVPQNYWKDKANHKLFFNWLGEELGYTKPEDWYLIDAKLIKDNNGGGLLIDWYDDSPSRFVKALLPDYEWIDWKFNSVPDNYWNDRKNRLNYMEWFKKQRNYTKPEDWYNAFHHDFISTILKPFPNQSHSLLIMDTYPEYDWKPWLFLASPSNFWNDKKNHKLFFYWLGEKLGYKQPEDWYNATGEEIRNNNGGGLLVGYYNGRHREFIMEMIPEYEWDKSKFNNYGYSKISLEWLDFLKESIPDIIHIKNNPDGEYIIPNTRYKADGYSEKEKTVFEFDGDYWHGNIDIYEPTRILLGGKTALQLYQRTLKKRKDIEKQGLKVVSVWESDWKRGKKAVIKLQQIWKKIY
jgi:hypothetical protein